jgi:hypothetical protein
VLGWLPGVRHRPEELARAFFSARFSRVLDPLGYATLMRWRLYAEEGLAGKEAGLWLQDDSLTVEYGGETLSRFEVEISAGNGKLRAVGQPRLFENAYALPQLRLFALEALGESGWLRALKLEEYSPRRSRRPQGLQQALFAYYVGWG